MSRLLLHVEYSIGFFLLTLPALTSKEQCGGAPCFMIENHQSFRRRGNDPQILISGGTGVEILAGLHYYLKNWDKTGGAQLFSVPKAGLLSRVGDGGDLVQRPVPWNYYQNAVTSSYSLAWWDWNRWEKEIDMMALQGINLPLAFTGQEAIWQKVFQKFNISKSDLDDFFGGPAFLAWSRMGNLHGWGGPLPPSWLDQQLILQKRILDRISSSLFRECSSSAQNYISISKDNAVRKLVASSTKVTKLALVSVQIEYLQYCFSFSVKSDPRWTHTYLLDATDPLFVEIGKKFIEEQLKDFGYKLYQRLVAATSGTLFGVSGSIFLLFSGPILIIAFLAVVFLAIFGEDELHEKKTSKNPRFRLWTFPVLVDGPFGVVSAAEFIGILLFTVYVLWNVGSNAANVLSSMSADLTIRMKCLLFLKRLGRQFGSVGLFCMSFLFLPVARGSVLLRLINIPFEHATKYHVWLGHLTMLLFTVHALFYLAAWTIEGRLLQKIFKWKDIGVSILPGLITLLAGLLMWATSFAAVRKLKFELFFYTHQLYVTFVVFLALHVGDTVFSIAAGGIFIFLLDRFLRFCQSRKVVDIISAKCLPCGTIELVLAKPETLRYNAPSIVFLQVRELSWLQWHRFSVSSTPLDGKDQISVLIKVLGKWTERLRGKILASSKDAPCSLPAKLTASVEGPYGHETPYHMMYENLILVAGGIGISPFLAIVRDILHSLRQGKPCVARNILIVWSVKRSDELPLLLTVDMESICPSFSNKLNLHSRIYVTQESDPPLEDGKIQRAVQSSHCPISAGFGISGLVGTGNHIWYGLYVISSTAGFVLLVALLDTFYINPFHISAWWYKGLLFVALMAMSVFGFGGFVVGMWHLCDRRMSAKEQSKDDSLHVKADHTKAVAHNDLDVKNLSNSTSICYGARPDINEIFASVSKDWGNVDVGVFICGPSALQSIVAKEIRSHSVRKQSIDPIFHFNSNSFGL